MRLQDLETGSLYWLPETRFEPPQRAVLIEHRRRTAESAATLLFEILPSDRGFDPRVGVREYRAADWAVARIEPCYDGA